MKLKICGATTIRGVELLIANRVDYVGINFITTSQRRVTIEQAMLLAEACRGAKIAVVALFQDQPLAVVNEYSRYIKADFVQLHGAESSTFASQIARPVMKAIAVDGKADSASLQSIIDTYPADYFILDRQNQGSGPAVDTSLAMQIAAANPQKIFLAGGLQTGNLENLVTSDLYGVDIASGARSGTTIDPQKVTALRQLTQ